MLKKLNSTKSSPDPENSWCGHQQPFNFFSVFCRFTDTSGRLRKILGGSEAKKLAVTGENYFCHYLKRKIFYRRSKKSLFRYT